MLRLHFAIKFIIVGLTMVLLASCASMSTEECVTADWYNIGFEDGTRGYAVSRISDHRQACADAKVRPDLTAYQKGHAKGLDVYCVPRKGYQIGEYGKQYSGICAGHNEGDFLKGYKVGKRVYEVRTLISELENRLSALHSEHQHITDTIRSNEAVVVADGTDRATRMERMHENRRLEKEKAGIEKEIRHTEHKLDGSHRKLQKLKNHPLAR